MSLSVGRVAHAAVAVVVAVVAAVIAVAAVAHGSSHDLLVVAQVYEGVFR